MRVLFREDEIEAGVDAVARDISTHYAGRDVTVLVVLRGGIVFAADLIRRLDLPVALDTVGVASYRGETAISSAKGPYTPWFSCPSSLTRVYTARLYGDVERC